MHLEGPNQESEALWAELRRALIPFVRSRVPSKEIAEDIVHDVLLKMAKKIGDLRDDERLQPWAFRIARNAVVDHYRKSDKEFAPLPSKEVGSEIENNLNTEVASWLPRFFKELPPADRELLEQIELQGLAQMDVARQTGIPYSSLKSKVQRARQKLKRLLENCCRIDFDKHGNVIDYRSQNCDC